MRVYGQRRCRTNTDLCVRVCMHRTFARCSRSRRTSPKTCQSTAPPTCAHMSCMLSTHSPAPDSRNWVSAIQRRCCQLVACLSAQQSLVRHVSAAPVRVIRRLCLSLNKTHAQHMPTHKCAYEERNTSTAGGKCARQKVHACTQQMAIIGACNNYPRAN